MDGDILRTFHQEAGQPLTSILKEPYDGSGHIIPCWYTDSGYTTPWNLDEDVMPSGTLDLYGTRQLLYSYEPVSLDVDGTALEGIMLTGYRGHAESVVLPEVFDGLPVLAVGESFLSESCSVQVLTIGPHILSIEDASMAAFTGRVICDASSAAEAWAQAKGLTVEICQYEIILMAEGVAVRTLRGAKGTQIALTAPQRGSSIFEGWYLDEARTFPVELVNNRYTIEGHDQILYGKFAEEESTPFTFDYGDGYIIVTGYTGTDSTVSIPETINGLPVTHIGSLAFEGSRLRQIDLGRVTTIGDEAFARCPNLTSAALPDSVVSVGSGAFAGCELLKTVLIGTGLRTFSPEWFEGCSLLDEIQVASGSTSFTAVDGILFDSTRTSLLFYPSGRSNTAYTIPDSTLTLGASSFAGAAALRHLTVPSGLLTVSEQAFKGCTALESFAAESVSTIGDYAFFGCTALQTFEPGAGLNQIGILAFGCCPKLTSVSIPESTVLEADQIIFTECAPTVTGKVNSSAHAYSQAWSLIFLDPDAVSVSDITLSASSAVLQRGESLQLTCTLTPDDAQIGHDVLWSSDYPDTVYVDENGLVSALRGGTATVTARTSTGCTAECVIEVQVQVSNILLDKDSVLLLPGETLPIQAELIPASATERKILWTSSDETAATVSEDGLLTALKDGEATITARAESGVSATLSLIVCTPVTSFEIPVPEQDLYAVNGLNTLQLTALAVPENASHPNPVWSSDNEDIATIDETGLVTAHYPGVFTITAAADDPVGISSSLTLQVLPRDLSDIEVPSVDPVAYDGQLHVPAPVLVLDGQTLEEGRDYILSLSDAPVNAGTYTLTVSGIGCYTGIAQSTFVIEQAQARITLPEEDEFWLDRTFPSVSVQPEGDYTVEFVRVEEDGSRVSAGAYPEEPGTYEMIVSVQDSNLQEARASKLLKFRQESVQILQTLTLLPGQCAQLPPAVFELMNSSPEFHWFISDASVLSVSEDGRVTALASGTADLVIFAADSPCFDACTITVVDDLPVMNLPSALKEIGEEAFASLPALRKAVSGNQVTSVAARAFADNPELTQITLPASVSSIAENAFEGSAPAVICPEDSYAWRFALSHGFAVILP